MRELNECGISARQRFQISEASYRAAKSSFARLWLRFRQYIGYPAQLLVVLGLERLFGRQATVCVVCTNTFFAPLIATFLHPKVVHLVYDLFPEAMIHSGKWKEGSLKTKCVRWIIRQTLRRARMNVFLGQRLKDYVELLHGQLQNSTVIEVGADQTLFGALENRKRVEHFEAESLKKTSFLVRHRQNENFREVSLKIANRRRKLVFHPKML